jgi:hypothetical protein
VTRPRFEFSREALLAALAALAFIAISTWWLLYDGRAPGGGDPGRHLSTVVVFVELLGDADFGSVVEFEGLTDFFYPPLVHLVGAVPGLLGLAVEDWGVVALNLVFIPMLVAGCYLVGRRVYGPRAGLLAAIFALGVPMVLQLSHVFMLDVPLTGAVALTVAALLASERFGRRRESVVAGALLGVAILVKPTAPLFVAGVVLVMLAGGGYRNWRNALLAAAATLLVAAPYFAVHLDDFLQLTKEASVASEDPWTQQFGWTFEGLERFSPESLVWYLWSAANVQLFAPLLCLFLVGLVVAIRDRRRSPYIPELLGGLGVGYLGVTFLSLHDPRYTLPLIVFVAVIATGWIATSTSTAVRGAAVGLLVGIVGLNVAAVTVGGLGTARITLFGEDDGDLIRPGDVTIVDHRGWVTGEPNPDSIWDRLLAAAQGEGMKTVAFTQHENLLNGTDFVGFDVVANDYGIEGTTFRTEYAQSDLRVDTWWFSPDEVFEKRGIPPPCETITEGAMTGGLDDELVKVSVSRLENGRYVRWCEF